MLTGRFEVLEALYGPQGYIERFRATFEQHCEGADPALFGQIEIINPPAPPALTIALTLDREGTARRVPGVATVEGTVTCSTPTTVDLSGTLVQRVSRFALARGSFNLSVECSLTPAPWSSEVVPMGDVRNTGQQAGSLRFAGTYCGDGGGVKAMSSSPR